MKAAQNRWVLLASLGVVAGLTWVTGRITEFSSNPLSALPRNQPEIEAREIYQRHFLQENDLVVAVRASTASDPREIAESLAQFLRGEYPELENRLRERFPWEADEGLEQMGALAGLGWVNSPSEEIQALAKRLSDPASIDRAIESALETLATSFSLEPEEAFLAIDPLGLAQIPGLPRPDSAQSEGLEFGSEDLRAILIDFPGDRNKAAEMATWQAKIEAGIAAWQQKRKDLPAPEEILISGYAPYVVELNQSMRLELIFSAVFTLSVVLFLFLVVYRTAYPLVVLAVGLAITCLSTIAMGGLIYGELNAISIGFAAILIALVVDCNVIVYQEQVQPSDPSDTFRAAVVRPVIWAAATTALVFSALNLSAIPGIAQLGSLVSVGLILGSAVSLTFFHQLIARKKLREPRSMKSLAVPSAWAVGTGLVILSVGIYALFSRGLPVMDTRPETMLPKYSESAVQYENLRRELGTDGAEPIAVLFRAESEASVREAMESWEESVSQLNGVKAAIPHALWPRSEIDFVALKQLASAWPTVRTKLDENFGETALGFAENAFAIWIARAEDRDPELGNLREATWILNQAVRIEPGELPTAKGLVSTTTGAWLDPVRNELLQLADADPRITLLGWDNLGPTLERLYRHDSRLVVLPSIVVLFVVLFLVFRSFRAVALSILTLGLSCVMLLALMRGLGIAWNQINLMAIPLLLGAGLDYNIHIQLALRRSGGNLEVVGQTTGKALLVCGLSTAAGFASLGWSHHPGLASLGQTCALGIVCTMFVAVMLLPGWWSSVVKQNCGKVS